MDAAEGDAEGKLYKASADLIPELRNKLPKLITYYGKSLPRLRRNVLDQKCHELTQLFDRFQEWPQLLDPYLAEFVKLLAEGLLEYLRLYRNDYNKCVKVSTSPIIPLPRAICRLLYTLCKVRGYKVITRLLNNEPKYIEPILQCFLHWNGPMTVSEPRRIDSNNMSWEERYVLLLWLSHLMFAPFELATISATQSTFLDENLLKLVKDLPGVAIDLVSLAFSQLSSPGKEREAAVILLVRLSLRRDMQQCGLPKRLVQYAIHTLTSENASTEITSYDYLGHLALLYGIVNAGSDSEVTPFLTKVFNSCYDLTTSGSVQSIKVRNSAPARKLLVKIMRVAMTHAISLSSRAESFVDEDELNSMLESGIQCFLDALSDKDTPVRIATSKALSMIALKLPVSLSAEVVDAVIASLAENVLLEDSHTGKLIPITDMRSEETIALKKTLSAVDPLRWHGLMLTLSHLLFRRSPPPNQLAEVIEALLLGLNFEQRSNVGTSVGVSVRDAACFGIWALARKYTTTELQNISVRDLTRQPSITPGQTHSSLQHVATQLVISACLDPSGNIRRGSSAALQELIGRHPDTISQGIPLVQAVDYHAVARRSRAMIEVVDRAANLDSTYHLELLYALLDWRGVRATDAESRRWAASVIGQLSCRLTMSNFSGLVEELCGDIRNLQTTNSGANAAARHGLLLAMAAILDHGDEHSANRSFKSMNSILDLELTEISGHLEGRVTIDIEYVMEAVARVLGSMAVYLRSQKRALRSDKIDRDFDQWTETVSATLNRCTLGSEKSFVVEACATANFEVFKLLSDGNKKAFLESWLDQHNQRRADFLSRGRNRSLALLFSEMQTRKDGSDFTLRILSYFDTMMTSSYSIEVKVTTMESLLTVISLNPEAYQEFGELTTRFLVAGLTDYSIDQRGDIGSLLRLQSLHTTDAFFEQILLRQNDLGDQKLLMEHIIRLAAEKLNKVRFRAWRMVQKYLPFLDNSILLTSSFEHIADISSERYYEQLVRLLPRNWLQRQLIIGLVSSAAGGTEELGRSCCSAVSSYIQSLGEDERQQIKLSMTETILSHLNTIASQEDREIVPMLDFLSFLVEQNLCHQASIAQSLGGTSDIWELMQKVHAPTSSMQRVESLIYAYSALLHVESCRTKALDKLTRMLLHRWPKIRNAAADVLFFETQIDLIVPCNWNSSVASIKPSVVEMRKILKVAGSGNAKP